MSFVRVPVEVYQSTDKVYALVRFRDAWFAVYYEGGHWRPLSDEKGDCELVSRGDAARRVSYHRWFAAQREAPT